MYLNHMVWFFMLSVAGFPAFSQWHVESKVSHCSLSNANTRVLSPQTDPLAARAHHVFERLLHVWEGEHMPPKLSVIECGERVLALSQSSGHIIITRQAVKLSLEGVASERIGPLAFVLAHELIHQLNDFSTINPPLESLFVQSIVGRERERTADAHAVILMALAGFDPYEVSNNREFFRRWTEAGLGVSCAKPSNPTDSALCIDAQSRSAAIQSNLNQVIERTALFEFGLQAFTIGRYDEAIAAFEDFGRVFRSAQVSLNLGLAHFARALQLGESVTLASDVRKVTFPTVLASNPGVALSRSGGSQARSAGDLTQLRAYHIKQAIEAFSQVIRLQPASDNGYAHLIFAYVLDSKLGMAAGVWKDQYPKPFRDEPMAHLVEAIIDLAEKRVDRARERLLSLDQRLRQPEWADSSFDTMRYVVSQNRYALVSDETIAFRTSWLDLANWARGAGRTLLFQLALVQLRSLDNLTPTSPVKHTASWRVGDNVSHLLNNREEVVLSLAVNQTILNVVAPSTEMRLIADPKKRVTHLWFNETTKVLRTLDELLAYYGPPDRHIATEAGLYLAYTQKGVGFKFVANQLVTVFNFIPTHSGEFNVGYHQAIAQ